MISGKSLKVLTVIQYASLIIATICVLVFQFLAHVVCVYLALGFYTLGFLIVMVRSILTTTEIFLASKQEQKEGALLLKKGGVDYVNTKSERIWAIISCLFWVAVFGFSLVVLIMYMTNYKIF